MTRDLSREIRLLLVSVEKHIGPPRERGWNHKPTEHTRRADHLRAQVDRLKLKLRTPKGQR